ncbi:MAG TPA: BON domain-containing protein [Actinomycetota bacterium]|nr:BON domain-containing protein [Actinomycetota bacterium]
MIADQWSDQPEKYLAQKVRDALAADPRVGELHVDVSIRGDRVFLTGTVPSDERRQAIEDLVRQGLPAHEVANHITVEPISGQPEVETLG